MDMSDNDYILASPEPFNIQVYLDLLDLVSYAEYGLDLSEVVASYDNGTHPYFRYQSTFLSLLSTDAGSRLYLSMLDYIRLFELRHPWAVYTTATIPRSQSFHVSAVSAHKPSKLPLEILDGIFSLVAHSDLLPVRWVSQDWCVAASRYTHSSIRFRMRADWQAEFDTPKK